jgi:hypothetical protein
MLAGAARPDEGETLSSDCVRILEGFRVLNQVMFSDELRVVPGVCERALG